MTDDIVTQLSTEEMTKAFYKAFPTVMTIEDAMRQALEAVDEIERLRATLKIVEEDRDYYRELLEEYENNSDIYQLVKDVEDYEND